MIDIKHADKADLCAKTTTRLAELVNSVYGDAESDLWKPNTSTRTNPVEIADHIKKGELLVARLNGNIVGVCKVCHSSEGICEFGMLAADPDCRGVGIGRELVSSAEKWARNAGYETMRLELLTPRDGINKTKEFLKVWYTRIGYAPAFTVPFEEEFEHRINDFAQACDFTVWLKPLK